MFSLRAAVNLIRNIGNALQRDMITVYAAQASFFVLLSGLPFLVLLISVSRLLAGATAAELFTLLSAAIPAEFAPAFTSLVDQLRALDNVSLVSVTAVTALWSASRGMAALERGLCGVYGVNNSRGLIRDSLRSVLYTLAFIALIFGTLFLLVFGVQIADMLMTFFPALELPLLRLIHARGLLVFCVLSLFFFLEHHVILHPVYSRKNRPALLPGALFSAAGWMLFSYFYSLYIQYFPRASYLFGSLAMLVILMLWIYFCMILLLCGAELNKMLEKHTHDTHFFARLFRKP